MWPELLNRPARRKLSVIVSNVLSTATIGLFVSLSVPPALAFSHERAGFSLKIGKEVFPHRVASVFVLPGDEVRLEVLDAPPTSAFHARMVGEASEGGALKMKAGDRWIWTAPKSAGLRTLMLVRQDAPDSIRVNLFVMVPYESLQGETLNGYRIGKYPEAALRGLEIYRPPKGFIEVTPELADVQLSPHFRVSQFLSKQEDGYPKYLVLREKLILKLELILETTNAGGYPCETFHVMSGYRTPHYNRAIGNVKYSRHVWGGAADIFIDENPRDGNMDDLNGDGLCDYQDAAVLYAIVDRLYGRPFYAKLMGGLARYHRTASHGPFVHLDVRGTHARWGD